MSPLLRWVCVALFVVNASAQTPQINEGGVVSGASFAAAPAAVSAGSVISIFGTELATSSVGAVDLPLPTNIDGAEVLVNDIAAPLFFVSPNQINAQLPWEFINAGMVNVQAVVNGVESNIVSISIAAQEPGLFATNQTGSGQGAILISGAGGSLAAPTDSPGARPVTRGQELIEIFCTGLGVVTNQPASGAPAPDNPLSETALPPTVTIGDVPALVSFSGLGPGFVGLYQVNAQVPKNVPIGEAVPVVLTIGGVDSNTVTIAVQPAPGEVVITVSPSSDTLQVNQTKQFTATVAEGSNQTVSWLVNEVLGGNSRVGTISTTGLYIAPAAVPTPDTVSIRAVIVADPTKSATAEVTITLPPSDNYPRANAGSVLRDSPPLSLITIHGSTVAVLDWTAKDESGTEEDVLAVCHSLTPSGIPHVHPASLQEALTYPVVAVAGVLNLKRRLRESERIPLINYVAGGGTLLLWRPSIDDLLEGLGIFAFQAHKGQNLRPLTFDPQTRDPALRYIDHDIEIHWQLTYR